MTPVNAGSGYSVSDVRERPDRAPSVTARVNAERAMLLGWSRAILMQLAHPLIAAGVAEHSSFRDGPAAGVQRLRQTVNTMRALTFGSPEDRQRGLNTIGAIHGRVHGVLRADAGCWRAGTRYSARDPDLVLWVHATLLDSIPLVYERVVGPLEAWERDAYCQEAAPVAVALGADDSSVPRTTGELRDCIERTWASGALAVGDDALTVAAAVLAPRMPLPLHPAAAMNRLVTIGLLPDRLRRAFGFEWSDQDERRLERTWSRLRRCRRLAPDWLALWPDARSYQRRQADATRRGEAACSAPGGVASKR